MYREWVEKGCIRPGHWLVEGVHVKRQGRRWLVGLPGETIEADTLYDAVGIVIDYREGY